LSLYLFKNKNFFLFLKEYVYKMQALLCLPVQHKDDMAAHLQDYFRKWVRNAPRKVHNPLFA